MFIQQPPPGEPRIDAGYMPEEADDSEKTIQDGYSRAINAWALNPVPCMALDIVGKLMLDAVRKVYPDIAVDNIADANLQDQEALFVRGQIVQDAVTIGHCSDPFNDLFTPRTMLMLARQIKNMLADPEQDTAANSMRISVHYRVDPGHKYTVVLHSLKIPKGDS
jgi:hypothetical protein